MRFLWLCGIAIAFCIDCSAQGLQSRYLRKSDGNYSAIVFIHGIGGNSTSTWTASNGAYWPDLIAKDPAFDSFDIYLYEYPTTSIGNTLSIDEVSENMRLFFDEDKVSKRDELVFVAHSMGGLALRAYLLKNREVAPRTRLAYFFSTPTTGSELASLGSIIGRSPQLEKMRPMLSPDYLADLQRQWLSASLDIPSFCAYETQKTYGVSVVTQASASNLCNRRLDPVDANHISIVKPTDRRQVPYLALKSAISQTPEKKRSTSDVISTAKIVLSHREYLDSVGYLDRREKDPHSALLSIDVKFSEVRYNNEVFFRSFDTLRAEIGGVGQKTAASANARLLGCSLTSGSTLNCRAIVTFEGRPPEGSTLVLALGPVEKQYKISSASFKWEKTTYDKYDAGFPWWVAVSEVIYEISSPDWLVLSSAEIFTGKDGLSLLRLTIVNPLERGATVSTLRVYAGYPFDSGHSCANGDRPQEITLRWAKLLSGSAGAVSTNLGEVDIPVAVRYNYAGICSGGYSIRADIPIKEAIAAKGEQQLLIKIKEMPPASNTPSQRTGPFTLPDLPNARNGLPPTNLIRWPKLGLSLEAGPGTKIKPDSMRIQNTQVVGNK